MNKCIIVGAGDFNETSLPIEKGDFVIAADGGIDNLAKLNIKPNLFVGDKDSCREFDESLPSVIFPSKKDFSDMLLGVKEGLKRGFKLFYIFGGMGGRFDHTLANLKVLHYLTKIDARGYLFGNNEVLTAFKDSSITFPSSFKGMFSIYTMGGDAYGVTISNAAYEVWDITFEDSSSLGLSNEFTGKEMTVSARKGTILINFPKREDFEVGF